jgi:hypothetical protein
MDLRRIMGTAVVVLLLSAASLSAGRSEVADAAMKGDKAALRTLIAEHADVNVPQADGATALHWVAYRGEKELADILIAAGANVKAANREGATPLWTFSGTTNCRLRPSLAKSTKGRLTLCHVLRVMANKH